LSATSTWHPSRGATERGAGALVVPAHYGRARRWAVGAVGLCLLAAAAWGVTHSRVFELRSLTVTGNSHLSSAQVASIGGVTSRTNILWLSPGALKLRLEGNPWIKEASISRTLPSLLSIAVVERTPAAVLAGSRLLVSSDGVVLGRADPATTLPLIEAEVPGSGTHALLPADLPALRIARELPPELLSRVARIGFDRSDRLILTLRGGIRVILGNGEAGAAKAAALGALLKWIDRHGIGIAYIDLTVPTAPAVLPVPRPSPAG
jgi:cell division protein FtsQ